MSLNVIMKLRQIHNKAKPSFRAREMLSGESVYRQPRLNLVKDFQEYCKYLLVMTKPGM